LRASVFNKNGIQVIIDEDIYNPESQYELQTISQVVKKIIPTIVIFLLIIIFTPCILGKAP
jgi:hypothetical protein